jgi:hypothetical protein
MDAETENPTVSEIIRSYPFRVLLYAGITFVMFQAIYGSIKSFGAAWLASENGPLEAAQVVLALVAAVGIFSAARWTSKGRAALVVAGAMVAYAAGRESDVLFETWIFDDAYKWLIGVPMLILAIVAVIVDRRRLLGETMWWMRQPSATLFAVAGIFLCFVCQNLDRSEMWLGLQPRQHVDTSKALVEEYAELFAYLLLAFSGVEAAILAFGERMHARRRQGNVEVKSARNDHIACEPDGVSAYPSGCSLLIHQPSESATRSVTAGYRTSAKGSTPPTGIAT